MHGTSKRLQVSGRRFLTLRMERALAGGDVHADEDSPRAPWISLLTGFVTAAMVIAVGAVLTVVRPQSEFGDTGVVVVRGSGAVYVRVGDVVHPALNLTSARLIAGGAEPIQVTEAAVASAKRGVSLGIPGAPVAIGAPLPEPESRWTVCDGTTTTVIVGALTGAAGPMAADQATLVTGPSGTVYLLYADRRARVDLTDPAVAAALRAEHLRPAPVSAALLGIVPEVAPIVTPSIPESGEPGPAALSGFSVGEVLQVRRATGVQYYAVLSGGVQRLGPFAAEVLRFRGPGTAVTTVAPDAVDTLPTVGVLPVESFPDHVSAVTGEGPTVCASWRAGAVQLLVGDLPLPGDPVRLAQADGAGPRTDAVYLPAGRSIYADDGTRAGAGWLVTEVGTRFGLGDVDSARDLALPVPAAAPRAVLEALPRGPELSRSAARAAHDGVAVTAP